MHTVPFEYLPEIRERKIFPFRSSPLPSPAPSRISSSSSRYKETVTAPAGDLPYALTAAGISILAEPGPAGRKVKGRENTSLPPELKQHHRHHIYHADHSMGHWDVQNDMNPWLAHENIPKWSTSSKAYGNCYAHPMQKYSFGVRNRMSLFQCHNRSPSLFNPQAF
eukprot:GEMP01069313.1.p1 GENE.GEMP01069313.1~~GEMP01069313.1.p1  ORF type:complete len:166 (+),score=26.27 GEMP01069313.1:120-617(+)